MKNGRATKDQKYTAAESLAITWMQEGIELAEAGLIDFAAGHKYIRFRKWATECHSYQIHQALNRSRRTPILDGDYRAYSDSAKAEVLEIAMQIMKSPYRFTELKRDFLEAVTA